MEEVIKYFESLESRLAAQEELRESIEARLAAAEERLAAAEERLAAAEERLAAQEETISALQNQIGETQQSPLLDQGTAMEFAKKTADKIATKLAEHMVVIPEEKSVEVPESRDTETPEEESGPVEIEEPVAEEPEPEETPTPVIEEKPSPKAAIYGKAVDDIRLAISLGDRFLYQRELFGQNGELMQKTLTELNALHSFDEAMQYISRFSWDTESNSYQQFIVTLHRRFG